MCHKFALLGPVQRKSEISANQPRAIGNKGREGGISRARKNEKQEDYEINVAF